MTISRDDMSQVKLSTDYLHKYLFHEKGGDIVSLLRGDKLATVADPESPT